MIEFYISKNRYKFTVRFWWILVLQPPFHTHILPMTPKVAGLSACLLTPASWLGSQRIVRSSSQYGCLRNCAVLNPRTDPLPTGPQNTPWKPQSFYILASSSWLKDYASLPNKQSSPPPHPSYKGEKRTTKRSGIRGSRQEKGREAVVPPCLGAPGGKGKAASQGTNTRIRQMQGKKGRARPHALVPLPWQLQGSLSC